MEIVNNWKCGKIVDNDDGTRTRGFRKNADFLVRIYRSPAAKKREKLSSESADTAELQ